MSGRPIVEIINPYKGQHERAVERLLQFADQFGFVLTARQASELAALMGRLPLTDEELVVRLQRFIRFDFDSADYETLLRSAMDECLKAAGPDAQRNASRVVMLLTRGLPGHPHWWDEGVPCGCEECCSY
jgi:hypothetical protein